MQEALKQSDRGTNDRIVKLEALLEQNLEATSKLNQAVAVIERSLNKQGDALAGPVSSTAAKVDAMSDQFAGLRDAVEESNSMITRLQREVDDIKTTLNTLPPPGAMTMGDDGEPIDGGGAFGDAFFTNAVTDYQRGNYELAQAQFTDFLRYSGASSRAVEAQYYLGAIAYNQGDFENAVQQFDMTLEKYPVGLVTADAQYKKAMALHKLGRIEDAGKEFQNVIDRFPNSTVAPNAQQMLTEIQGGGGKPSPLRP